MPRTFALLSGALVTCALVLSTGTPVNTWDVQAAPTRVVAIGDVHGSFSGLVSVLKAAGLIDAANRWSGGTATLVQTGDLTDRGADVRDVLDLMMALDRDAPKAGGRVEALLGNHEMMNLLGELRDATPEICARFADAKSTATREDAWKDYERLARARNRERPDESPAAFPRTREGFMAAYPPGCIEYRVALGPRGSYGKWLRSQPIAAEVEGTLFMHAGPDPAAAPASIDDMNARARQEVERFDRFLQRLVSARMARPWFRSEDAIGVAAAEVRWTAGLIETAKTRGEAPDLSRVDVELVREASEILQMGTWSLLAPEGPLWYRGYATADDADLEAPFSALLTRWHLQRLAVGHTVNRDHRIRARLNGRLFLLDTGMLAPVYHGRASALELVGDRATAIYADGTRIPLVPALPTP